MNLFLVAIRPIFLAILLLPFFAFAQTNSGTCSTKGYTIETINGVFTDEVSAVNNKKALGYFFGGSYKGEPLTVDYLLNPSHLGGLGDLIDSVVQKAFENETVSDYDLIEMLNDASTKVQTQKLLLVAHSQGNFYANSFYDTVADKVGGVPAQSIGVYGVADPASRVAGNGKWLTSDTDNVIAGLVAHLAPFHTIMTPNVHIAEFANNSSPLAGHGFTDVYLQYQSKRIVADIQASLDKLSSDPERREDTSCIDPPNLTLAHKVEGVALAIADTAITATSGTVAQSYNTYATLFSGAYNLAINTAATVGSAINSATVAVSSGLNNVVTGLISGGSTTPTNSNLASVIGATQTTPAPTQPTTTTSQTEQSPQNALAMNSDTTITQTPILEDTPATNLAIPQTLTTNTENTSTTALPNANTTPSAVVTTYGGTAPPTTTSSGNVTPQELGYSTETTDIPEVSSTTTEQLAIPELSVAQCDSSLSIATDECLIATTTIKFAWQPVSGAQFYILNEGGTIATTTDTAVSIVAPDFSDYTFTVSAVGLNGQASDTDTKTISIATIPIAINEIAWMGTVASANDEWIELKNNTPHTIDLSLWSIVAKDGAPHISLTGTIAPHEYRVIERGREAVTSVSAGQVYGNDGSQWALGNTGEELNLLYSSSTIDQTPDGAWVAGYNTTTKRKTMERISSTASGFNSSNWRTNDSLIKNGVDSAGNTIDGTPGAQNSVSTAHDADTAAPVITVRGSNPATLSVGTTYRDEGATALDAVDGTVTVTTASNVDTNRAGEYIVTYTASDLSHNIATLTRTVNVNTVDIVEPSTSLLSSDLDGNGIADNEETNVVVSNTIALPAGEYHFHNLTLTNNATIIAKGDPDSFNAFKGVRIIADNLTIEAGSSISADGQGGLGEGSCFEEGASYGGAGGGNSATSTYGSSLKPIDLGTGKCFSHGGGAIRIIVTGDLSNNGTVSANGGGQRSSGGSIYISTGILTGSGVFTANGADASWPSSLAGGGGRISVYYKQSSYLGNSNADAGKYCSYGCNPSGGAGTVALIDTTNNDFYAGSSWRFQKDDGPFNFNHIYILNSAVAVIEDEAAISANQLLLQDSSLSFAKRSLTTIPNVTIKRGTLTLSGEETFIVNTMTLLIRGMVTTVPKQRLYLSLTNLRMNVDSEISANYAGYAQGEGPSSTSYISGASYGGAGLYNTANSTYGSEREPTDFGSAGNGHYPRGGGAIRLIASGDFVNDGRITAYGAETSSGGSIYITANHLSGAGEFHADGGSLYCNSVCVGSGGGGRIAIYYNDSSFTGTKSASGLNSYYGVSGDGTVVFEQIGSFSTTTVPQVPAQTLSSDKAIVSFGLALATSTVAGVINEGSHTITLTIPYGTDLKNISPAITVSSLATLSPASAVTQDFTNPIVYTVTAEDGSIQVYTVTVSVDPAPVSSPVVLPMIVSYSFNGIESDVAADFATTTASVTLILTANKNVNWMSIKIEEQNDATKYKTFFSGAECVDGTATCSKTWDGKLSSGGAVAPGEVYRVKVHIKDDAGNEYDDFLTPYKITSN